MMKTLIESIFGDNITNDLNISLELIEAEIINSLKKYKLKEVDCKDLFYKGYIPQQPFIMIDDDTVNDGYINIAVFSPNELIYKDSQNRDEEVYIGVNVNISKGDEYDHQDPNKYYLRRVDVEIYESKHKQLYPHSRTLWDLNGWKRHSLKTNEINEKTIKSIVKYIVNLFDLVLKMMDRDRQEIYGIFKMPNQVRYYNEKDEFWYLNKMKEELD